MSVASVGLSPVTPAPPPVDKTAGKQNDTATQEKKVKPQVIDSTTRNLQRLSSAFNNKKLQFVVDHNSNEVIVKVIDKDSDKVSKVLPPEEL
ncbi:MAG: flagellar protein FlaG [Treponema sp.]|jgi:uncharacterized FlaG/YvyC family protein|nr:flagellar protein FlaG [Treponema sp.]